jgi:hypothetical protein
MAGRRLPKGSRSQKGPIVPGGNRYRGFESPLCVSERQESRIEARSERPVFGPSGRVRGQVGGKIDRARLVDQSACPFPTANLPVKYSLRIDSASSSIQRSRPTFCEQV